LNRFSEHIQHTDVTYIVAQRIMIWDHKILL